MKTIDIQPGLRIAYTDTGAGAPVMLLHGNGGSRRYYDDVLPALAARYRVIAPDLRGHGASSAPEGVYTMEELADDALALMDRLGLAQAYVLGHSLGGYVALALAERRPDRLLGFGLLHSTAYADTEQARENRLAAAEAIRRDGVAPFIDALVPKLFAPANRTALADAVDKAKRIGYEAAPQGLIGTALGMRERPDRRRVLAEAQSPVLLLAGELDEIVPPERRFPAAAPHITAAELAGVGHMGMMEAPQPFADAILAYLDRAQAERGGTTDV